MALLDIFKKKKETPTQKRVGIPTPDAKKSRDVEKKVEKEGTPMPKGVGKGKPNTLEVKKSKSKKEIVKGKKEERFSHIILRPRITEKASLQSGGNSYTFEVAIYANKIQIKQAIREVYNVDPIRVNIIRMKPKQKIIRGVKGRASSFKKAIVFLKDGDSIEFV